mmetsp:Transcript_30487/g.87517  ORF Transcript_30487/g.87517 Transcript_30487/m.87517 type:complete len:240 (+) Transcript_30487:237-956(+)
MHLGRLGHDLHRPPEVRTQQKGYPPHDGLRLEQKVLILDDNSVIEGGRKVVIAPGVDIPDVYHTAGDLVLALDAIDRAWKREGGDAVLKIIGCLAPSGQMGNGAPDHLDEQGAVIQLLRVAGWGHVLPPLAARFTDPPEPRTQLRKVRYVGIQCVGQEIGAGVEHANDLHSSEDPCYAHGTVQLPQERKGNQRWAPENPAAQSTGHAQRAGHGSHQKQPLDDKHGEQRAQHQTSMHALA